MLSQLSNELNVFKSTESMCDTKPSHRYIIIGVFIRHKQPRSKLFWCSTRKTRERNITPVLVDTYTVPKQGAQQHRRGYSRLARRGIMLRYFDSVYSLDGPAKHVAVQIWLEPCGKSRKRALCWWEEVHQGKITANKKVNSISQKEDIELV